MDEGPSGPSEGLVALVDKDLYNPFEVHGEPAETDEARTVWLLDSGVQVTLRPITPEGQFVEIQGDSDEVQRLINVRMLKLACVEPRTAEQVYLMGHALEQLGMDTGDIGHIMFSLGAQMGSETELPPALEEAIEGHYARLEESLAQLGETRELNISPEDFS